MQIVPYPEALYTINSRYETSHHHFPIRYRSGGRDGDDDKDGTCMEEKKKWSCAVDFQNLPIREYARKEEKNKRIYNTKIIVEKQQMSHRTHGFYYFQKAFLTAYNKINAIQRQVLRAIHKEEKKFNSWWVQFPQLSICTISEFYTTEVKRKNG